MKLSCKVLLFALLLRKIKLGEFKSDQKYFAK